MRAAAICTTSISKRLARTLGLLMLAGLGLASAVIFSATAMRMREVHAETLADKTHLASGLIATACTRGEDYLVSRLIHFEQSSQGTHLSLHRTDGSLLYADNTEPHFVFSELREFTVPTPNLPGGELRARMALDTTHDTRMLKGLALTLILATAGCAALTSLGIRWVVRRDLQPLEDLAAQTRAISPERLQQRLHLDGPAAELQPWIEQFNALMGRLERAYQQLEGFNADVAHELRTPLANLIGQTELALSRDRGVEELRDTLVSNLEEMQRLSTLVNDMLFLSHADRGAVARRGEPVSLAALANEVLEFHEAQLEESQLRLRVDGDVHAPVDASLVKRALSNLLGNAARFAQPGSTVVVQLGTLHAATAERREVQVWVENVGEPIPEQALPRLFDRFFRCEASRACDREQHHGLGLAIVAAIARMHDGRTLAHSHAGVTRIGFTLAG
jgi:two-component system heavy metal sensor histidine kinase CusS